MQIVTLTLHPALDKSTTTAHIVPDHKLRCTALQLDAGGGGINVSKGIRKLDGQSTAVFPVGGSNGRILRDLVDHLARVIHHRPSTAALLQGCCEAVEFPPGEVITSSHPLVEFRMSRLLVVLLDHPTHFSR